MKKRLKNVLLPLLVAISMGCFAQNNSVGIGTITPDNSAILDLVSTNQGLLIPRNNTFGITSIAAPSDGLILYNIDDKCYWFWNNSAWKKLCETDSLLTLINNLGDTIGFIYDSLAVHNTNINNLYDSVNLINNHLGVVDSILLNKWDIYGNTGTNSTTNFLGTIDNVDLVFRRFGLRAGLLNISLLNTSFGVNALRLNTTGQYNTANGVNALYFNTTGSFNTANGVNSLYSNTTGINNTAIGLNALYLNTTGSSNTATGSNALHTNTTGTFNTANGTNSLYTNTTGGYNTANGMNSLYFNTIGSGNTATGTTALLLNTTGINNTATGVNSLYSNTIGDINTANGANSLYFNTTGGYNTATGVNSLYTNTIGNGNTATGTTSLYLNTIGTNNTANGINALYTNTTGNYNTGLGYQTLYTNTTGGYNTAIGSNASYNGNFTNSSALGYNTSITASNQVRLGDVNIISIGGFSAWTNLSDSRFKKNIIENVIGLDFIKKLRPVTYNLDIDAIAEYYSTPDSLRLFESEKIKSSEVQIGFIAQEVEKAAKELNFDFHGVDRPKNDKDYYGLRYAEFVPSIVKAIQEQQEQIEQLINENKELKKLLDNK